MRKKIELPEVEPVKLESFHGIRPGIIILAILIVAILLIFFLLFMLPGIINGGKYVLFKSNLSNVGVYLDGTYLGSTEGSRYFIPSGEHDFRYVKDGITISEEKREIGHPIFFTLFFHRGEDIEIAYTADEELGKAIDETFLNSVSSWSKVTSFNSVTHLPPLFSAYAKDILALNRELDTNLWRKAVAHISSKEMYDDYSAACSLLNIEVEFSDSYFTAEDDNDNVNRNHTAIAPQKDGNYYIYPASTFEMGSYLGNKYPLTNEKRIEVSTESFAIADRPVSEYDYALFVSENPSWSLSNKENLIKEGLVDENYLSGISLSTSYESIRPIRNISYYAALAYIDWVTEKDGVSYRLPTEEEWSLTAYSAENKRYATNLNWMDMDESTPDMMLGGVWEYTSSSYVPLSRTLGYDNAELENDDVVIKGGSYINSSESVNADTVGMIAKARCSDYVGFRLVRNE